MTTDPNLANAILERLERLEAKLDGNGPVVTALRGGRRCASGLN